MNNSNAILCTNKLLHPGYVYLLSAVGTSNFKIGKTSIAVSRRIKELQTGCPLQLRYVYHACVEDMNKTEFDQTDEYPLGSVDHASRKAYESIDSDLDKWWTISCLAANRNKHEHFPLSYHGEKDGAIKVALKELTKQYLGWKHSVKVCELNWMNKLKNEE